MKPTHPVDLICYGISTQEGYFDPSGTKIPQVRRNPGNLRYAGQIGATRPDGYMGPVRPVEPVAVFATKALGQGALYRQVWKRVCEGKSISKIIPEYAPPNENDTAKYLQNVLHWTGLPADVPVLELLPPLERLT